MKNAISMLKQIFAAIQLMFVVPGHNRTSAREIVAFRMTGSILVSRVTYAIVALVWIALVLTCVFSPIFRLPVPESASLIARMGVIVMLLTIVAEMLYHSWFCNEDRLISRRRTAAWWA